MSDPLIERLAALALRLVVDPPSGDDPVVRFATPTDLVAAFEDSVGLAIGDDLTLVHDHHAVTDHADLGEHVAAEQDGVGLAQALDDPPGVDHLGGIDAIRRLIEDEHRWLVEDRLRDTDPLTIPLREPADERAAVVRNLRQLHGFVDPLLPALAIHVA